MVLESLCNGAAPKRAPTLAQTMSSVFLTNTQKEGWHLKAQSRKKHARSKGRRCLRGNDDPLNVVAPLIQLPKGSVCPSACGEWPAAPEIATCRAAPSPTRAHARASGPFRPLRGTRLAKSMAPPPTRTPSSRSCRKGQSPACPCACLWPPS